MSLEGVFRKNGNVRELNEICDTVNRDATSLVYLDETPIQLAALLKRFLRDLPEPLLTFKLYDLLIASIRKHFSDIEGGGEDHHTVLSNIRVYIHRYTRGEQIQKGASLGMLHVAQSKQGYDANVVSFFEMGGNVS